MKQNTGGPAFPHNPHADREGISMRDYFAAKAMQGMMSDIPKTCYGIDWKETVAREAWAVADAMLAAREVTP